MEKFFCGVLGKNHIMKKSVLVAIVVLAGSVVFAQKKVKQPLPPPPPVANVSEVVPPPPPPLPPKMADISKEQQTFFKRNPNVKGIDRNNKEVRIHLKSGKEEVFDLNNKEDVEKLKNQYGELPAPPPPPPPPPAPGIPKKISES